MSRTFSSNIFLDFSNRYLELIKSLKNNFIIVILIGNYMNGGTNKGQAHGIKLSGLVCLFISLFFFMNYIF